MGVPKGAGNLRGARDKNWTVVAACLRSFRRALTAVHPEPARGPTLVTSATQLKIGEPCEFSANHENRPEFLDVTLQSRPTENGVSPPLFALPVLASGALSSEQRAPHVRVALVVRTDARFARPGARRTSMGAFAGDGPFPISPGSNDVRAGCCCCCSWLVVLVLHLR